MWIMELKTSNGWVPIKASHATEPYKYETQAEAEKMLKICYPDQCREQRLGGAEIVRVRSV